MSGKCPCCGTELQQHDIKVDLNTNTLAVGWSDQMVKLSATQAEIAYVLARNGNADVATIARGVWGKNNQCGARSLKTHIAELRKKVSPVGVTVSNVGSGNWRLERVGVEAGA